MELGRVLWGKYILIKVITAVLLLVCPVPPVSGGLGSTLSSAVEYVTDFTCSFKSECCREPFVRRKTAAKNLRRTLQREFFGQHVAADIVANSLDAHLSDENPSKPLVLSFHGWAGSGKTFLAELIANSLFEKGINSKYVRMYTASYNFPDEDKVKDYWKVLQEEIKTTLGACDYALIIFDEVDVTPSGLFDSLVTFLESFSSLPVAHKKAIYIFLSNIGSNAITHITKQAWEDGKRRTELTIHDFHDAISIESFNALKTGLSKTRIIERALIDYFVPFLPMERQHVVECAKAEIKRLRASADPETIADEMTYWPADLKLFSQTGCKRIEVLVKYHISASKFREEL